MTSRQVFATSHKQTASLVLKNICVVTECQLTLVSFQVQKIQLQILIQE